MAKKTIENPAPAAPPVQAAQPLAPYTGEAPDHGELLKQVIQGSLAQLSAEDQARYVLQVCQTLGLNPATAPIRILTIKGRTILYVLKDGTEQLRKIHGVSLHICAREVIAGDVYVVTARAQMPSGRTDEATGAVCLAGLAGEDRANAIMRAETKSKRRVTLSICGLGFLDESEVADIPDARPQVQEQSAPAQIAGPTTTPTPVPVAPQPATLKPLTNDQANRLDELVTALKLTPEQLAKGLVQSYGVGDWHLLTEQQAAEVIIRMETALKKKGAA